MDDGSSRDRRTLGSVLLEYSLDSLNQYQVHDCLLARFGQPTAPRMLQAEFRRITRVLATELFGDHEVPAEFAG